MCRCSGRTSGLHENARGKPLQSVIFGKDLGVLDKADLVRGVPVKFAEPVPVEVLEVTAVNR